MTVASPIDRPFSALPQAITATGASPAKAPSAGPLSWLLKLFSSIWLGVVLLALLFVYCSIGSSGVPTGLNILDPAVWVSVRQFRGLELTEFEWFHWWPFDLLIALICVNIIVATVRRIRFNVVNLGVWMIHSGIIILALGSVWYFSTKIEGDTPVVRRRLIIEAPGAAPISMLALPGHRAVVGSGADAYLLEVSDIDPQWELLSGDDVGQRAYKVAVTVQGKAGTFIRNLIANRPQYTEDLIRTSDPKQPMQRAIKAIGKPLIDESLSVRLEYEPQDHFYLMDSHALYLREVGQRQWVQRPIENLPRYNDYIASADDVWPGAGRDQTLTPGPLERLMGRDPATPVRGVAVPAVEPGDPLPGVEFGVSRYLRYAVLEEKRRPLETGRIDPTAVVSLRTPGASSAAIQLRAFDPAASVALEGALRFGWIESASEIERLKVRTDPVIVFTTADGKVIELPATPSATGDGFRDIPGTGYAFMVEDLQDQMVIGSSVRSVAIIQLRRAAEGQSPARTFKRWVFDTPDIKRDMALAEGMAGHEAEIPFDESIQTLYRPGTRPPAPILVLAGPGENDLGVLVTLASGQPRWTPAKEGDVIEVAQGVTLTIDRYAARTIAETRPTIVPREQRDRDVGEMMSMIALDVPGLGPDGAAQSVWLPYHQYAFNSPEDVLRRFPYRPEVVTINGKSIELMFSRCRMPLPAPVVLDEFRVATHIGGFTGQTSSIMDWTSAVRFADDSSPGDPWSDPKIVSVNNPAEHDGYWFFQAQWDPPDPARQPGETASRGLNYTVLGVGNRNGVHVQLAGCVLAVIGMMYAFYAKPAIKRRRQRAVYATAKNPALRTDVIQRVDS